MNLVNEILETLLEGEADEFKEVYGPPEPERTFLPLGSVSSGTLNPDHLIPIYLAVLAKMTQQDFAAFIEGEDKDYIVNEWLPDKIQGFCAPYTYFGSHPGDGADIGVWVDDEGIEEALLYDEDDYLKAVRRGQPLPAGSKYIVVLGPNDEHEALLDGATGKEIWSQ